MEFWRQIFSPGKVFKSEFKNPKFDTPGIFLGYFWGAITKDLVQELYNDIIYNIRKSLLRRRELYNILRDICTYTRQSIFDGKKKTAIGRRAK